MASDQPTNSSEKAWHVVTALVLSTTRLIFYNRVKSVMAVATTSNQLALSCAHKNAILQVAFFA